MTNILKYFNLLVIFFLLSSSVFAKDAIDRYTPITFCKPSQWGSMCSEQIELAWLREIGSKGKRVKDQLILRLQNGRTIIRKDSPKDIEGFWVSEGKPNVSYCLYAYLKKEGFYILRVGYWEDESYEFISEKDGSSVIVGNRPIFSPDRSIFLVSESAEMYDEGPKTLQIWRIRTGGISKMWSQTVDWPRVSASWISNKDIHLYEEKWKDGHPIIGRKLGMIRLSNEKWVLDE